MHPHVAEVTQRLESLIGRPAVPEEYVRLRIGVLQAQVIILEELADSVIEPLAGPAPGGPPAVRPEQVRWDLALGLRLFDMLEEACRRHGEDAATWDKLDAVVRRRPRLLGGLVRRAALASDRRYLDLAAERTGGPAGLLLPVARWMAAPFVTHVSKRLLPQSESLPPGGPGCPICGSEPGLASVATADGRRRLHCSLCGGTWTPGLPACPFCDGSASAELSKLAADDDPARWIEACPQCRHYLKVIDTRQIADPEAFCPLVEAVAGLPLDGVALREGYAGGPTYAALW